MLRIGFDGRALASPAAGMRRYAQELFRALALLDPSLAIVAVGTPAGVSVPMGIEVAAGAKSLPTNFGWMLTGLQGSISFTPRHTPRRSAGPGRSF